MSITPFHRLGLGAVQFGLAYGITNVAGQVPAAVTAAILAEAQRCGIRVLDTAALYGSSEQVLGTLLPPDAPFDIVTKTAKFADVGDEAAAVKRLDETFTASLENLRRRRVYGLITHDADDLLGRHGTALWDALVSQRAAGRVRKIGASVYTGAQIDGLLARYPLELVQLPINALDWRLITGGQLARLKQRGIEVHARSLFLQGLLLQTPTSIASRFAPLQSCVAELHRRFAERGLTPLSGALAFGLQRAEIDCLIVGVTLQAEFHEIVASIHAAAASRAEHDNSDLAIEDERILSPARWHELGPAPRA